MAGTNKKIKVGIYSPRLLKKAIDELVEEDIQQRGFSQYVVDILLDNKEIATKMKELQLKEKKI
jgi:aspartate/glutamate racemase